MSKTSCSISQSDAAISHKPGECMLYKQQALWCSCLSHALYRLQKGLDACREALLRLALPHPAVTFLLTSRNPRRQLLHLNKVSVGISTVLDPQHAQYSKLLISGTLCRAVVSLMSCR